MAKTESSKSGSKKTSGEGKSVKAKAGTQKATAPVSSKADDVSGTSKETPRSR
jgi:hypothetical protein